MKVMWWKNFRHQHRFWRWLVFGVITFILSISILTNFSLAIDPPLEFGEGRFVQLGEGVSAHNEKYQEDVTKTPKGQVYAVGTSREVSRTGYVKFDGRVGDTLLEAKGYNYKVKNNGEWSDSEGGKRQIAKEAKKAVRQILALQWAEKREGKSLKIELRLAEQKYIKAFQTVLQEAVKLNKTIQSSVTKITFQHVHSEDAKKLYAEHRKKQRKKSTDSSH
jgi:hypothetical protein